MSKKNEQPEQLQPAQANEPQEAKQEQLPHSPFLTSNSTGFNERHPDEWGQKESGKE